MLEDVVVIIKNKVGWVLLEYLKIAEDEMQNYDNVTGAFAIINVNGHYLIGFNSWRKQWEFPDGGIEAAETAREVNVEIIRQSAQNVWEAMWNFFIW